MKYYTPKEILEHKEEIKDTLGSEASWVVKSGLILDLLKKYKIPKSAKILDSGCASGRQMKQLEDAGYMAWGTDIDNYLQYPFKNFKKLDFCFELLPFKDRTFDVIISSQVIEHLENQFFYLREIHRALKPGGILILSLPNAYSLRNRLEFLFKGDLVDYLPHNNHIGLMTKAIFKKATVNDFELLEIKYAGLKIPKILKYVLKWLKPTELTAAKTLYVLKKY